MARDSRLFLIFFMFAMYFVVLGFSLFLSFLFSFFLSLFSSEGDGKPEGTSVTAEVTSTGSEVTPTKKRAKKRKHTPDGVDHDDGRCHDEDGNKNGGDRVTDCDTFESPSKKKKKKRRRKSGANGEAPQPVTDEEVSVMSPGDDGVRRRKPLSASVDLSQSDLDDAELQAPSFGPQAEKKKKKKKRRISANQTTWFFFSL